MSESLGKATLDLSVGKLPEFEQGMKRAGRAADATQDDLDKLAEISKLAADALQHIKMTAGQSRETAAVTDSMERSVSGVSRNALDAADHLHNVKMEERQAIETKAVTEEIDGALDKTNRKAKETRRSLESVKLSGIVSGARSGIGVGPFGSGFGRVGVLGSAIGAGVLATPAAVPGLAGLAAVGGVGLAGIGGTVATLVLALQGVGKAIGGDKKAFDALQPSQKAFVLQIRSMTGWINTLKQTAGQNLFAGVTKGLQAALSPGTVGAITTAVAELAKALGNAADQWGRFFGSREFQSIFGPLMAAAASAIGTLSGAALNLFDALGVVSRAGIPFTAWLTSSIARGTKWINTLVHAKDASGALAKGFDHARESLTLVAKVIGAVGKATIDLGKALYPVSNVFLKDVISGFSSLDGIIQRNSGTITRFAGTMVDGMKTIVQGVATGLGIISKGWDAVFGSGGSMVATLAIVGAAIAATLEPEAVPIAGAILAAGYIRDHWETIQVWFSAFTAWLPNSFKGMWDAVAGVTRLGVYATLLPIEGLARGFSAVSGWLGALHIPGISGLAKGAAGAADTVTNLIEGVRKGAVNELKGTWASFAPYLQAAQNGATISDAVRNAGAFITANYGKGSTSSTATVPTVPSTSDFGAVPAWTTNLGPKAKTTTKRLGLPSTIGGTYAYGRQALGLALSQASASGSYGINLAGMNDSSPSGINLLPDSIRLLLDRAKGTPGTKDDLKALKTARSYLERFTETFKDIAKIPIADEIASLSKSINGLSKSVDTATGSLAANEEQFLTSFFDIQEKYAPNAYPEAVPEGVSAKQSATHLYDSKHTLRQIHEELRSIRKSTASPGSFSAKAAELAVYG